MNSQNTRLTYVRRIEMVQDITQRGVSVPQAAAAYGVSAPTARKRLGRYWVDGELGLGDASSRPARPLRAIELAKALAIVELRHKRLTQPRTAAALGVSKSTGNRLLARAGVSSLNNLDPVEPIDAVAYYVRLGGPVRRLLTENGPVFRSGDFAAACKELGARHRP